MSFSFQLYSSRDVASQESFLSRLSELGYTQVEGYGGVYGDPASFAPVKISPLPTAGVLGTPRPEAECHLPEP